MQIITITAETEDEAQEILDVLRNAEEEGVLDFSFGTELKEENE